MVYRNGVISSPTDRNRWQGLNTESVADPSPFKMLDKNAQCGIFEEEKKQVQKRVLWIVYR